MGSWIEARPKLHIPGLIDSQKDECHITLAYLGDADPADVMGLMQENGQVYRGGYWPSSPVISEVSGLARWITGDGDHVDVALISPPIPKIDGVSNIYDLQERVYNKVNREFPVDQTYPFVPHITLPGGFGVDPISARKTLHARYMFSITELYVSHTTPEGSVNNLILPPQD